MPLIAVPGTFTGIWKARPGQVPRMRRGALVKPQVVRDEGDEVTER
jgi:hypothetical protein